MIKNQGLSFRKNLRESPFFICNMGKNWEGHSMGIQFDYYYGMQSEQFTFYRVPKVLFTNPQFKGLSSDAKLRKEEN